MRNFQLLYISITLLSSCPCDAFTTTPPQSRYSSSSTQTTIQHPKHSRIHNTQLSSHVDRRSFIIPASVATMGVFGLNILPVMAALPLITVAEFETILKDSAKSISSVELSGPKSETALVTLVDGTKFGISDLYESPTDPRSPLKLVATCRSYNVPTKFVGYEEALSKLTSTSSKKKKVYMNKRVQEAAEKEKEKKERLAQDEAERLMELEKMNQSEVAAASVNENVGNKDE